MYEGYKFVDLMYAEVGSLFFSFFFFVIFKGRKIVSIRGFLHTKGWRHDEDVDVKG